LEPPRFPRLELFKVDRDSRLITISKYGLNTVAEYLGRNCDQKVLLSCWKPWPYPSYSLHSFIL